MSKAITNKVLAGITLIAIASGGAFLVYKNKNSTARNSSDTVIASVNGSPIYASDINSKLQQMSRKNSSDTPNFAQLDPKLKDIVVRGIAAENLILKKAYKDGYDKNEDIEQKVSNYKNVLIKEEYLATIAKKAVTDEKINERYNILVNQLKGKTQFSTKHILLSSEKAAKSAKRSLKNKSFSEVAKLKSIDKSTALKGGDLGYLLSGTMPKEFEDTITNLKIGQVSKPIQTQLGWHLLKVESKRPAEPLPLDQIKGQIAQDVFNSAIQEYVENILQDAKIEIFSNNTQPSNTETPQEPNNNG